MPASANLTFNKSNKMIIDLTQQEIKMLEARRWDLERGLIDITETKALLNRIYSKLGKEPRKKKQKPDLVALMMKNRKTQ